MCAELEKSKLINGGVLDRYPELVVHIAHLGGIASMLGRIRSYQDMEFRGTGASDRHGCVPEKDFDYYIRERLVFDTAGFCGDVRSVKSTIVELPTDRIVFASDYPQEIRKPEAVKKFVDDIRAIGAEGEAMLSGNVGLLLDD